MEEEREQRERRGNLIVGGVVLPEFKACWCFISCQEI